MKNALPRLVSTILFLCAVFALAAPASAQDWAKSILDKSPRHQEWVKVKYGSRTVDAFVVYPEVSHKAPVVLLIHEIFGLSDWARSMADDIAAMGYIVIAPDLLSGFGPSGGGTSSFPDQQSVIKAVSSLDPAIVTADLNATADYALKFPSANGKLAVIGFCWGGGQSFRFATNRKNLAAAFVFYGPPPSAEPSRPSPPPYSASTPAATRASLPPFPTQKPPWPPQAKSTTRRFTTAQATASCAPAKIPPTPTPPTPPPAPKPWRA